MSLKHLSHSELKQRLAAYKYISPTESLFERIYLNKFWDWVAATIYPPWLAPNMITLTGFLCFMTSMIILLTYSPNVGGDTPHWWLLFVASMGFVYQTMDGSDGKHARNIRGGSPLGEMFDHGCDALITIFYPLLSVELFRVGFSHWLGLLAPVTAQLSFFLSNLTLLHKGRQEFQDFDCQEAQVMIQVMLMIGFVFGRSVYLTELIIPTGKLGILGSVLEQAIQHSPFLFSMTPPTDVSDYSHPHMYKAKDGSVSYGFELRWLILFFCTMFAIFTVLKLLFTLRSHYELPKDIPLKQGQGRAALSQQVFAIITHTVLVSVAWTFTHKLAATKEYIWVCFVVMAMFSAADLSNHALLTRVTQVPFPAFHEHLITLWLLIYIAGCGLESFEICVSATVGSLCLYVADVVPLCRRLSSALGRQMFFM